MYYVSIKYLVRYKEKVWPCERGLKLYTFVIFFTKLADLFLLCQKGMGLFGQAGVLVNAKG